MRSSDQVSLVYHPDLLQYDFGPQHPLRPERIELGLDLLRALDIWDTSAETCIPIAASDDLLGLIHDPAYIAAVRAAEQRGLGASELSRFGLTSSDNPPFPNMHYAASLVAGGAAEAARAVMKRELDHVFIRQGVSIMRTAAALPASASITIRHWRPRWRLRSLEPGLRTSTSTVTTAMECSGCSTMPRLS